IVGVARPDGAVRSPYWKAFSVARLSKDCSVQLAAVLRQKAVKLVRIDFKLDSFVFHREQAVWALTPKRAFLPFFAGRFLSRWTRRRLHPSRLHLLES